MKKTYIALGAALVLILVLALILRPSGSGTYDNLIRNGSFEALNGSLPRDWDTDAYFPQKSYTDYSVSADGLSGSAGHIVNRQANDARFYQTVSVSPDTLYHLHGYIKADAAGGLGANLSIEGVYVFSDQVYDSQGEWQEVSLYGRTGANQRSLTVYARLGGYSGEATGEAWFDDITLNRVDAVPADYSEYLLEDTEDSSAGTEGRTATGAWALVLGSMAYTVLFALLLRWFKKQPERQDTALDRWAILVCLLGLAVRVAVGAAVPGYDVDIGCFRGWAAEMATVGPFDFYQKAGFCDYPPGYLWILGILGALGRVLGTGVTEFMVKLPPILCDGALCLLLYREGKKTLSRPAALALTALYAFNPLTIVTGAAWGQADSVMLLLLFLVVVFALRGKWSSALPLYMAAVLVKPQALMFGPLGLAALVLSAVQKEKKDGLLREVLLGLGLLAVTALSVAGPFLIHQEKPVSWILELYQSTMSQYGYVTVNACNLYFLLGKNWVSAENSLQGEALLAGIVFCMAAAPVLASCLTEKKNPLRSALLLGLCALLGAALLVVGLTAHLTYAVLGTMMIVFDVALFLLLYALGKDAKNLPLLGASLLLTLFNTGTMMHERYLFPAVGLLLLSYALRKDRRILALAIAVSITGLINVGCCLDRNIRIGGAEGHLNAPAVGIASDMMLLEMLSAVGNCLAGAYSLYLCAALCRDDADVRAFQAENAGAGNRAAVSPQALPPISQEPFRKMTRKDWAILSLVTVLYALLAFTNLGSLKSPQTAWVSQDADEAVVLDLGQERTFKMLFFPGIHWRADQETAEFDVQVSLDGETWEGAYEGSVRSGETYDCFSWKYVTDPAAYDNDAVMHGRYVRLTSRFSDLTLLEVLLRDADTADVLPVVSAAETYVTRGPDGEILSASGSAQNATLPFLTDEQDTLDGEPGYMNSTYFDEIYHARTAYEHLHGLPVYETTHPPLGKVLMSFAIAVFGMTPFGWRFAGALAGVLMLPGMYLLGKLLIRKKWGGFAAMMLMALDLMHFTQTRIATIDSFVVLFIIWSVYFMLRWFFLDYFRTDFWKTLVPLGLSGLFMGLAVASKWTGCYAGAGLAVLFFYGLWRRWRQVRAAGQIPVKKRTADEKAAAAGVRPLILTVLSCFVFFVAVPLAIYYVSYIPYFAPSGGVSVEKIIRAAEGMLDYHSTPGLGMDHSFYSPWYQWPVIGKPMWYYAGSYEPEGKAATIMAMGNPAVWWVGLLGLMGVLCLLLRRHYDEKNHTLRRFALEDDPRYAVLLICFAAQYLPWVPVPRGTYIYHYFPSVPFIILCAELCLEKIETLFPKAARWVLVIWLVVAAGLFVAFFPYASGITVSKGWLEAMRWFPRWLWY